MARRSVIRQAITCVLLVSFIYTCYHLLITKNDYDPALDIRKNQLDPHYFSTKLDTAGIDGGGGQLDEDSGRGLVLKVAEGDGAVDGGRDVGEDNVIGENELQQKDDVEAQGENVVVENAEENAVESAVNIMGEDEIQQKDNVAVQGEKMVVMENAEENTMESAVNIMGENEMQQKDNVAVQGEKYAEENAVENAANIMEVYEEQQDDDVAVSGENMMVENAEENKKGTTVESSYNGGQQAEKMDSPGELQGTLDLTKHKNDEKAGIAQAPSNHRKTLKKVPKDCDIRAILSNNFADPDLVLRALKYCFQGFYNRVPKCGSRAVLGTFKRLANNHSFDLVDMERWKNQNYFPSHSIVDAFVRNFTRIKPPFLYSQHVHYVNFARYNMAPPVYINVIREPIDRLGSHYYYNIYGSHSAPKNLTDNQKKNMSLDECVRLQRHRCMDINVVVPFFCGHSSMCRSGSAAALKLAKRNLQSEYLVVGVQEDLPAFMELLEILLPQFFKNATTTFTKIEDEMKAKYSTVQRNEPEKATVTALKKHLAHEYDFYYFVKAQFYHTLSVMRTQLLT